MIAALRRHPFAVEAFFRHALVLTFAYPQELLQGMLPPGLRVDAHDGCGFLAIALVETESLRPAGFPTCLGRNFFLAGYRIFSRYRRQDGRELRGLRILRSFTDKRSMVFAGNLFTRYDYQRCRVARRIGVGSLAYTISTLGAIADLTVTAHIGGPAAGPPPGSPFADLKTARQFAGPLPFTFGYEEATRSMVIVQGQREHWQPMPVEVEGVHSSFLAGPAFAGHPQRLANAFYIERIPYRWKRGDIESPSESGA